MILLVFLVAFIIVLFMRVMMIIIMIVIMIIIMIVFILPLLMHMPEVLMIVNTILILMIMKLVIDLKNETYEIIKNQDPIIREVKFKTIRKRKILSIWVLIIIDNHSFRMI